MVATWIEASAQGRNGGPVRAGMWSAVVIGTHPVEADQQVWLELLVDDVALGPLPAYWLENKGVNSLWHVPVPPQPAGTRLRYRSGASKGESPPTLSPYQEVVVRPNLPDRSESNDVASLSPEGLVGNRMMTARVDSRGSTFDIYYPTVGLHSDVRPAEGDLRQGRSHFRAIVGGLAVGRRLDWFSERSSWDVFQTHLGATNLLVTDLSWRHGSIKIRATDFVVMGDDMPRTAGGTESPGQYIKRYRIRNEGDEPRKAIFGVYVQAEVNGGIGEPGLSWHDEDRCLLASNRGHGHVNRKLARDATVEFGIALDDKGPVQCEPTGPNEAILLRPVDLPAGGAVCIDLIVTGAFTGWRGDPGTYEHWTRPALTWFRAADLDRIEQATADAWDEFVEPLPELEVSHTGYGVALRRSALAIALHADAKWGAVASGFDRGINAYCWPRDALFAGGAMDRVGHPEIGRSVFDWLARVRGQQRPYAYWFQKYTIDGWPEWETPAVDQSAMIPWAIEAHYRRTGDLERAQAWWPMIEQAAAVCMGEAGHPGLSYLDDLALISSAGIWDTRFGAFLYSNAAVVAGLRAAARLADLLGKPDKVARPWTDRAERMWHEGILGVSKPGEITPGLVDSESGRFLEARRLSNLRGLWTDRAESLVERSAALDIGLLGPTVPYDLLPATDPRMKQSADAILRRNQAVGEGPAVSFWLPEPGKAEPKRTNGEAQRPELSSLASLWMARYLIRLGHETADARFWTRAVGLLDTLLSRLSPLGLGLRPRGKRESSPQGSIRPSEGVWGLQSMLIDTLLDLGGLDYDAPSRELKLQPALPAAWPHLGLSQTFPCGTLSYRLSQSIPGPHYGLELRGRLLHPVTLGVSLVCPEPAEFGGWASSTGGQAPRFDRGTSRLEWTHELPEGEINVRWSWGRASVAEGLEV